MDTLLASLGLTDTSKIITMTHSALRIVLILFGAWVLRYFASKGIRAFREYMTNRKANWQDKQRLETLGLVFRYTINVILSIVAGMLVLTELGISIAPILATAGVLGLAVGFGAQSLVKDYFSGFFLLLEDQIRFGDVVTVGGKSGLVEEVTLRFVRLRAYDGSVHFVPNGQIDSVTNMTRDYSFAVLDIGIAYRENIDDAFVVIRQIAAELRADEKYQDIILEDVDLAGVENWAASAISIRFRIKVQPTQQSTIKHEFLRRLKIAFDAQGIEIPFPHLTVYAGQFKDGSAPPFQFVTSKE